MSYLYLAPNIERSAFKIGYSNNPASRLTKVDGNINFNKTYIFECAKPCKIESFCHKHFKDFKRKIYEGDGHTEWFDISIFELAKELLIKNVTLLQILDHFAYNKRFLRPIRKIIWNKYQEPKTNANTEINNIPIDDIYHFRENAGVVIMKHQKDITFIDTSLKLLKSEYGSLFVRTNANRMVAVSKVKGWVRLENNHYIVFNDIEDKIRIKRSLVAEIKNIFNPIFIL